MTVSNQSTDRRRLLPVRWAGVAVGAGFVTLFGTYWDDAWHTDRGRDDAWIAPHLVLYGAVAVVGVVVALWALGVMRSARSVRAAFAEPSLLMAGLGGAAVLAAAPLDGGWHAAFGRDAVLWSPPHLLAVVGSAMLVVGVLSGAVRTRRGVLEAAAVAVLLGASVVPVLEYETDVPQFSEVLYLPVLLAGGLAAVGVARALLPGRRVIAPAVLGYAAARLVIAGLLALAGFSTPDLPVAVLGLAVVDLPWRTAWLRYGAAAAAVSGLAWLSTGAGLASQAGRSVAMMAIPVLAVVTAAAILAASRSRLMLVTATLVGAGMLALTSPAPPASAHDPGQGAGLGVVEVSAVSDGTGTVSMAARLTGQCDAEPMALLARRAGSAVRAALVTSGGCRVRGTVHGLRPGRWFLYVQVQSAGRPAETWLPVEAGQVQRLTAQRELYRPAGGPGLSAGEVAAGAGLYGLIAVLLTATAWCLRRTSVLRSRRPR